MHFPNDPFVREAPKRLQVDKNGWKLQKGSQVNDTYHLLRDLKCAANAYVQISLPDPEPGPPKQVCSLVIAGTEALGEVHGPSCPWEMGQSAAAKMLLENAPPGEGGGQVKCRFNCSKIISNVYWSQDNFHRVKTIMLLSLPQGDTGDRAHSFEIREPQDSDQE